jgi:hypothetical protein
MSTAKSGVLSDPPKVIITPPGEEPPMPRQPSQAAMRAMAQAAMSAREKEKYEKVWKLDLYRRNSPGQKLVPTFLEWAGEIPSGSTIVDWGCGMGLAGAALYEETDLDITMLDIASNCLNESVKDLIEDNDRIRFMEHDIRQKTDFVSDYGFCCDLLEHIPPEDIDVALSNVLLSSRHVFFQIATEPEGYGDHPDVNEELHLIVERYNWWLRKFADQEVIVLRSEELKHGVLFYVTGYATPWFRSSDCELNVEFDVIRENIIANSKLGLKHIMPHEIQDTEVMLVCGGPTMLDFKDEIIEKREGGMPLITVNGSYNLMIDWGLRPSLQCMIDAREFNRRFVEQIPGYTDSTQYIISTQCDTKVLEGLPKDRTYLWDVSLRYSEIELTKQYHGTIYEDWWPCPGGCSVTLRAMTLLRMLGYHRLHVYGFDSCNFDEHHAYEQTENDGARTVDIVVGRDTPKEKTFQCELWQVYQAQDFIRMTTRVFNDMDMIVYGDGMINHILETAAEMEETVPHSIDDLIEPPEGGVRNTS